MFFQRTYFLTVGSSAFILDIWGEENAPYSQLLFASFLLGCTISPQMVKPFLSGFQSSCLGASNGYMYVNYSHSSVVAEIASNANAGLNYSEYELLERSTEIPCVDSQIFETRLHFGFVIIGAFLLLGAFLHLGFNIFTAGCTLKHIHLCKTVSATKSVKSKNRRKNLRFNAVKIFQVSLIGLAAFVFGGHSTMFGSFLVDYTVTGLHWNIKPATDITSLFWASNLVSKVAAALLSRRLTVTFLFGCSSILILFSSILILFTPSLPSIALWISVVGTGLGLGSVTSYCIVLGLEVISSTDIISSLVLVCIYVGKVTTSPLIGYVFQNVSYTWFLYISLMFSLILFIDHILYTSLLYYQKRQKQARHQRTVCTLAS